MNYFLVDYENVHSVGLAGIERLDENDVVVIFYSEKADTITFELHEIMFMSTALFLFQKASVGEKNALDFQLVTYLGFLLRDTMIPDGDTNRYFIVSADKGYQHVYLFLQKLGIMNVRYCKTISKGIPFRMIAGKAPDADKQDGQRSILPSLETLFLTPEKDEFMCCQQKQDESVLQNERKNIDSDDEYRRVNEEEDIITYSDVVSFLQSNAVKCRVGIILSKMDIDKPGRKKIFSIIERCKTRQELDKCIMDEFNDAFLAEKVYGSISSIISEKRV